LLIPQGLRATANHWQVGDGVADISYCVRASVMVTVTAVPRDATPSETPMKFQFPREPEDATSPSRHHPRIHLYLRFGELLASVKETALHSSCYFTIRPWFQRRLSLCAIGNPSHSTRSFSLVGGGNTGTFIERNTGWLCRFKLALDRRASLLHSFVCCQNPCHLRSLSSIRSYSPNLKDSNF